MDKNWLNKCKKAHANILKCLEEAYRMKDINLMLTNLQRLNDLTTHYEKDIELRLEQVSTLKIELKCAEQGLREIQDEMFLSVSGSKGRYKEAKQMLEDFYNNLNE